MDDPSVSKATNQPAHTIGGEDMPRRWQFSLSHLFLATIPVGLLFAWLGALKSTTWLHLALAGTVTAGYLAVECFGNHAALTGIGRFWRAGYFVARMGVFQGTCFLACLISFRWMPPPNLPPEPEPPVSLSQALGHLFDAIVVFLPYFLGAVVTFAAAWLANLIAAVRIRRARWLLIATTLPGLGSVLLILWVLINEH